MPKESKLTISPSLKALSDVIAEWNELIMKYVEEFPDDPPLWSTERANVGILAAAAWKAGGLSLEEYDAEKLKGKKRKKRRVDLFIRTANKREFVCEAKQALIRIDPKTKVGDVHKEIDAWLSEAVTDVRRIEGEEACRLGVFFAIPRVSTKITMKDALDIFNKAMKQTEADLKLPVLIPKSAKWADDPQYLYPGVTLFGRKV